MNKVGKRLQQCRIENQETLEDIGKIAGVNKSTVKRWESGETSNIKLPIIEKLADHFGVDVGWLSGKEVSKNIKTLPSNATPIDFNNLYRIPILGRIAAGKPLYAVENIEGYTYTDLNEGAEYFALRVKGDSMNAMRIFDNDIVIVRRQCVVEDGEVAVVIVDHEDATMKRFYRTGSTVTLLPQSNNPEHNPQIYDLAKTNIEIIGKVVKVEFML